MTEAKSTAESQASTNTQRILTEDLFGFLIKSMIPIVITRIIELLAVFSSLMYQQRNVQGFTQDDALFYFVFYQIFATYLPLAFQTPLLIRYSAAHVSGDREQGRMAVQNYLLVTIICTGILLCVAYPIVLLMRKQFSISDRLFPSCLYFAFFQFALSSFSTSYGVKYLAEGRKLLYLAAKSATFGIWMFIESFVYQFASKKAQYKDNTISVVSCGVAHLVVVMWLQLWNNKKPLLNAINLSEDIITIKDIFQRTGKWNRTKSVLMFVAEACLIFLSYCTSIIVLLIIIKQTQEFSQREEIVIQLENYFVYCDVFKIVTHAHLQLLSLVYIVTLTKHQYKRSADAIFKLHVLSVLMSVALFLLTFYGKFQVFFKTSDSDFKAFLNTKAYSQNTIYAYLLTTLQIIAETSQVFIIHTNAVLTLLVIVALKLVTGIVAMNKMVYYYGEDCDMMLVIAFSEGIAIAAHAVEVIAEGILLQLRIKKLKAQSPRKHHKS